MTVDVDDEEKTWWRSPLLRTSLAGLTLQNPVLAASGTFGYGIEYGGLVDVTKLGGICTKGVSIDPWPGNRPPRLAETPAGMLNAIGLQNPGAAAFAEDYLSWLAEQTPAVVVNIVGRTIEEYAAVAAFLDRKAGIDALEINISCPNIKKGGLSFGTDPQAAAAVVKAVRRVTSLPLIAKLTPNVTDITQIACAVEAAGADAVSLINTITGMIIDVNRRRPLLANVFGGLSGPAIMPVALRMVWQVYEAVKIPIIGMGGITSAHDALQFIMAGARAVAVGSATFRRPDTMVEVVRGLYDYCREQRTSIAALVGVAHGGAH